jgi:zinc transport system substrate-binding protein
MKKTLLLAISALIITMGCTKSTTTSKPVISVSILPQKYFVERITGDKFDINVLLPPGMSPHTFEPAPKTLADLSKSAVYFTIGQLEFEKAWLEKFRSVNKNLIISDTSKGVNFIEAGGCDHHDDHKCGRHHEEHNDEHGHDEHDHTGIDPHIWMSAKEVMIIAKNILDGIVKIDSENSEFYKSNYDSFIKDLEKLDMQIRTMLSDAVNRKFIIYHPALAYFARDYGFEEISIEIDGKEPSAAQVKNIIDTARAMGIKTVFIQKQFDSRMAESIAKEIGGKVEQLDHLSGDWLNNMIFISRTLQFESK